MNKKTRKDSIHHSKKSGLISEFLKQSSYVNSSEDKKEFISEIRTSRQFLYIGPQMRNGSYKMFEKNQTQLFQSFGVASVESTQNEKIKIAKDSPLKESFVKSQIDNTTYESLMNEFMGSYLEERLQFQQQKYRTKKFGDTQTNQQFNSIDYQSITSQKQNISLTDDSQSPIYCKDSQITFSGSKQSRIINQNQQSRIVKQQYFLLDQLKKSKRQKNMESPFKGIKNEMPNGQQNLIEESYRLQSPTSSKKFSKSNEKSKEKSGKIYNGKTKIQQINLSKEIRNKNIFKKPHQKYQISKKNINDKNCESKNIHKNSQSFNKNIKIGQKKRIKSNQKFNVGQTKSDRQLQKSFEDDSKKQRMNSQRKEAFQNLSLNRRSSLNKSLNSFKTFHLSSNKAQNLSRIQKINSIKQKSEPQLLLNQNKQEPKKISVDLKKRVQQSQNSVRQKQRHRTQSPLVSKHPNQYIYEYSYKIDKIEQSPLRFGKQNNEKSNQKGVYIKNQTNFQNQTQFRKDRQIISEIKKDLTKLIQKISIAKT